MDIGLTEFRELISIRENVRQSVESLELCWSCQRVCECEQWLVNEAVPLWLCGKCVVEVSRRVEEQTGVPLRMERSHPGQAPACRVPSGASQETSSETATGQVWMRECPRCKAPIEQPRLDDVWKCPRCGSE